MNMDFNIIVTSQKQFWIALPLEITEKEFLKIEFKLLKAYM